MILTAYKSELAVQFRPHHPSVFVLHPHIPLYLNPGGCFIKLVYQISQAYFSNSDLFSLDLVPESKITIAQAQSLWQIMLAN